MATKRNELIPTYQSHKLRVCSFILILLIVWLHSNLTHFGATGWNFSLQSLVSSGFSSVGVVMFFLISGYLFFRTDKPYNLLFFKYKIKKRFFSLFIPFVLWNALGLIVVTLISTFLNILGHPELAMSPISSAKELLSSLFFYSKYTYQLWFIRDLFILALASPILWILIHKLKDLFLLLLITYGLFAFPIGFVGSDPIFFFSLGVYLAIVHPDTLFYRLPLKILIVIILIYVIGTVVHVLYYHLPAPMSLCLRLLGCFVLWFGYDYIPSLQRFNRNALLNATFFIYTAHEPLLTFIKKSLLYILGNSQTAILTIFFIAPCIVLILCVLFRCILYKYAKPVLLVLSGNR